MKNLLLSFLDFILVLLFAILFVVLVFGLSSGNLPVVAINGTPIGIPNLANLGLKASNWQGPVISINGTPVSMPSLPDFEMRNPLPTFETRIEKKNLVDDTPIPTPTLRPPPTSTPDPVRYKNEIISRTKYFATTLDSFFQAHEQLRTNSKLFSDPAWQHDVQTRLDLFVSAANDLGKAGPAPAQYQAIQQILLAVGPETNSIRNHYLRGIQTGSQDEMKAASDSMNRIYDLMSRLQVEMVKAGWNP